MALPGGAKRRAGDNQVAQSRSLQRLHQKSTHVESCVIAEGYFEKGAAARETRNTTRNRLATPSPPRKRISSTPAKALTDLRLGRGAEPD